MNQIIAQLLSIQKADAAASQLKKQLRVFPDRHQKAQNLIDAKVAEKEEAKATLQELEAKRNSQRTERRAKEELVQKLLGQQLIVKKNEEYQGLEKEISHTRELIEEMEGVELETLMSIDEETERVAKIDVSFDTELAELQSKADEIAKEEKELQIEFEAADQQLQEARANASEEAIGHYDRIRGSIKNLPVVAELEGQSCSGCHLKVSADVIGDLRDSIEIHYCDKCGRIIVAK